MPAIRAAQRRPDHVTRPVSLSEGIEVDGITLWVLGGLTRMASDPTTPGAELRISGAGPLTSLVLGL